VSRVKVIFVNALLALLLVATGARAQDDDEAVRLREPAPEAYIAAMPALTTGLGSGVEYVNVECEYESDFINLLIGEFIFRYGDVMDAELLLNLYKELDIYYPTYSTFEEPYLSPRDWNIRIVEQWLSDNPTDLDEVDNLSFVEYEIDVEAHDFDADGKHEWLLYVTRGDQRVDYADLWIAHHDPAQPSGYHIHGTDLPWYVDLDGWVFTREEAPRTITHFDDLNADGKPELAVWVCCIWQAGMGATGSYGEFYLMGWNDDGGMRMLTARVRTDEDGEEHIWPSLPGFPGRFENIDGDAALEWVWTLRHPDSWQCIREEHFVYDWDGVYYMEAQVQDAYEETVNCAVRQAEDAAWHRAPDDRSKWLGSCQNLVQGDQLGDESGRNAFQVDGELTDGDISAEELLVNATERAQEIAYRRPHVLDGVDVHFTDAIAIVITRPFASAMTNGGAGPAHMIVSTPFIGTDMRVDLGEGVHMCFQGLPVGVMDDAQANLAAFSPNGADNRGTVIIIGAVPSAFVGAAARWIGRISVWFTFFPPRSETFHPFQSVHRVTGSPVASLRRWRGSACASRGPSAGSLRFRAPFLPLAALYTPRAAARSPVRAGNACPQTLSRYRLCTPLGNPCIDTPSLGFSSSSETRVPPPRLRYSVDMPILRGESASAARLHLSHRPVVLQWESPCAYFTLRTLF
jgi:hypothetical protein